MEYLDIAALPYAICETEIFGFGGFLHFDALR